MRAYFSLRADDRPMAARAWLYRVAHNRCIDAMRRPAPLPAEQEDVAGERPLRPARRGDAPRGARSASSTDMRRLPDQQRSALLMRELEGLSLRRARPGARLHAARGQVAARTRADRPGRRARGSRRRVHGDPHGPRRDVRAPRAVQRTRAQAHARLRRLPLVPGGAPGQLARARGALAVVRSIRLDHEAAWSRGIGRRRSRRRGGRRGARGRRRRRRHRRRWCEHRRRDERRVAVGGGAVAATATKVAVVVCCVAGVAGGADKIEHSVTPTRHTSPATARSFTPRRRAGLLGGSPGPAREAPAQTLAASRSPQPRATSRSRRPSRRRQTPRRPPTQTSAKLRTTQLRR